MTINFSINTMNVINDAKKYFNRKPIDKNTLPFLDFLQMLQSSSPSSVSRSLLERHMTVQDSRFSATAYPVYVTGGATAEFEVEYRPLFELPITEILEMASSRVAIFDKGTITSSEIFRDAHLATHDRSRTHHRARLKDDIISVRHDFSVDAAHIDLFVKKAIVKHIATLVFNETQLQLKNKKEVKEKSNEGPEQPEAAPTRERTRRTDSTRTEDLTHGAKRSSQAEKVDEEQISDERASKKKRRKAHEKNEILRSTNALEHDQTEREHR